MINDPLINCLGRTIAHAVFEVEEKTKAPLALIATTALAASAAAVQLAFDVKRPNHLTGPTSLYALTIAESGERKSTVDKFFFGVFRDFDNEVYRTRQSDTNSSVSNKPFRLIYSDTTPHAFLRGLHENSASALLLEDEAGRIFNGRMVSDLGLLNKAWGGDDLYVDRVSNSFRVLNPRVGISWMVQPDVFEKYMQKKGDQIRTIGFLPRCLIAWPESRMGFRNESLRFANPDKYSNSLARWEAVVTDLLQRELKIHNTHQNLRSRPAIEFSEEAGWRFHRFQGEMEALMQPNRDFFHCREYAAKVAENCARIAAVIHIFDGGEGSKISEYTVDRAVDIAWSYACEYKRIFQPPSHQQIEEAYGKILWNWLDEYFRSNGTNWVYRTFVLQFGPNLLRKAAHLNLALQCLIKQGFVYQNFAPGDCLNSKHKKEAIYLAQNGLMLPQSSWMGATQAMTQL